MYYVVYDKTSTVRIDGLNGGPRRQQFSGMAAARAARTRFLRAQAVYTVNDILIADRDTFYREIELSRVVKNLQSGIEVSIRANTPWCCNPASEAYWSQ